MPGRHKTPLPGWHRRPGLRHGCGRRQPSRAAELAALRFEGLDGEHEQGEQGEADEPVQHGRNPS